jgi:hypothetical protein
LPLNNVKFGLISNYSTSDICAAARMYCIQLNILAPALYWLLLSRVPISCKGKYGIG